MKIRCIACTLCHTSCIAAYMAQQILHTQGISIPFITTLHGTDIVVGKDPSFEPVITFSINQSNIVTAVSENLNRNKSTF